MTSLVQQLAAKARESAAVLDAMIKARELVIEAVLGMDDALASLQQEPSDVVDLTARALVLRGTVENVVEEAFRVRDERENRT